MHSTTSHRSGFPNREYSSAKFCKINLNLICNIIFELSWIPIFRVFIKYINRMPSLCRALLTIFWNRIEWINLWDNSSFRHLLGKSANCYPFYIAQADERVPENPCLNNPCGANSVCRVVNNQGACSCLPNYLGRPPNCRPECVIDSECPSNKACQNERCVEPCIGKCGVNALCSVVNHKPVCSCISGYEGDPYTQCTIRPVTRKTL